MCVFSALREEGALSKMRGGKRPQQCLTEAMSLASWQQALWGGEGRGTARTLGAVIGTLSLAVQLKYIYIVIYNYIYIYLNISGE